MTSWMNKLPAVAMRESGATGRSPGPHRQTSSRHGKLPEPRHRLRDALLADVAKGKPQVTCQSGPEHLSGKQQYAGLQHQAPGHLPAFA